jgi:two-component system chemotaxis sensor kinase CheA
VENAFDRLRKGEVAPSAALFAVALRAKDRMRLLIEQPQTVAGDEGAAILAELTDVMENAATAVAGVAAPRRSWRVRFALPRTAMALGTNPLLLLEELRELGEARVVADISAVPGLEEIDPVGCYIRWEVMLRTDQPRAAIEQVFLFVLDDMELSIEPAEAGAEIDAAAGAALAAAAAQAPMAAAAGGPDGEATETAGGGRAAKPAATIKVPAERLDVLMDCVGELVIAQSRLTQIAANSADPAVKSVAEELERLSLELRDTTMGIRMLPIGSLFGRFRRLVHDLAHELGKSIALITVGEETELDKTVIERLNDPLVHLIRNAVDHGLETPDERALAGKPPLGRITLTARHAGAEVLVSIKEDGRGMDCARILARAEENGLVPPGAQLAEHELFQLIFQPGFSTAREVTNLSGRGVGMDVVKRTIDQLRGSIDIASKLGQGTEVTLRLPLTLAIIDGLLVRVGRFRYVIPLSAVGECVELSAQDDARSRGRSFLNIRGDLVPFLRLRELFNSSTQAERYQKVVVVESGELRIGLVVDQVIGDHQTVIKSLSKLHADLQIFSGATILGDGTVALILDIAHLVEFGQRHEENLRAAG